MADENYDRTVVTLKEYFTKLLEEHDRRFELRFTAKDEALALARDESNRKLEEVAAQHERRFEQLNELRKQVTEDRGQFVTKERYSIEQSSLSERITRLETRSTSWLWLVPIIINIIGLILIWYYKNK